MARSRRKQKGTKKPAKPNSFRNQKTPASAFQTIFDTYELLENVLSHLPARDLLLSQRVCFRFRSTIAQSNRLQQNLFRKCRWDETTWFQIGYNGATGEYVDERAAVNPIWLEIRTGKDRDDIPADLENHPLNYTCAIPFVINPFFCTPGCSYSDLSKQDIHQRFRPNCRSFTLDSSSLFETPDALDMFLTQPPVEEIEAYNPLGGGAILRNSRGVTLRDVIAGWENPVGVLDLYLPEGVYVTEEEKALIEAKDAARGKIDWEAAEEAYQEETDRRVAEETYEQHWQQKYERGGFMGSSSGSYWH